MGHASKQMVYEVYGNYVEGLEHDVENILNYFGPDFIYTKPPKVISFNHLENGEEQAVIEVKAA